MLDMNGLRNDANFRKRSRAEQEYIVRSLVAQDLAKNPEVVQQLGQAGIAMTADKVARSFKPVLADTGDVQLTDQDRELFDRAYAVNPTNKMLDFARGLIETVQPLSAGILSPGGLKTELGRAVKDDLEVKYAYWLGEKASTGDQQAIKLATDYMAEKAANKSSLLLKAVTLGKDAYEFLTTGNRELDLSLRPKERDQVTEWLSRQLPKTAAEDAAAISGLVGAGAGMVELVGLNGIFVGSAAAPGLLTGKIFQNVGKARMASTGLGNLFFKTAENWGIEAVASGAINTLATLPEDVLAGKYQGSKQFWTGIAKNFGEGFAFDMLFGMATDAARIALRPAFRVLAGKRLDVGSKDYIQQLTDTFAAGDPAATEKILQSQLTGIIDQATFNRLDDAGKKEYMNAVSHARMLEQGKVLDPDSDEFIPLLAQSTGYRAEVAPSGPNRFTIKRGDSVVAQFDDRASAFNWLAVNQNHRIGPDELFEYRGQDTATLKVAFTGQLDLEDLSLPDLQAMVGTTKNGALDGRTTAEAFKTMVRKADSSIDPKIIDDTITYGYRSEAKFLQEAQNIQKMISDSPNRLLLPKTITDPRTRQVLGDYITAFGKKVTPLFDSVPTAAPSRRFFNDEALVQAAKQLDNGSLVREGDAWKLSYVGTDGAPVTRSFFSNEQVGAGLNAELIRSGKIPEAEITQAIKRETGVSFVPVPDPTGSGITVIKAVDTNGKEIATGPSVLSILEQRPYLSPRFDENLGPKLFVLDRTGKVRFERTVAAGPMSELMNVANGFGGSKIPASWKVVAKDGKRNVVIKAAGESFRPKYAIEVNSLGYTTDFTTLDKAKEFIQTQDVNFNTVRAAAENKGWAMSVLPDGRLGLSDFEGNRTVAANLDEATKFVREAPTASTHMNLVTAVDETVDAALVTKMRERIEDVDFDSVTPEWVRTETTQMLDAQKKALNPQSVMNFIDATMAPAYSSMERMAKRAGLPDMPFKMNQYALRARFVGQHTLQGERIISSIGRINGKIIDKNTADVLGQLLQFDQANWATKAKQLGFDLSPQHETILRNSRAYLDRLAEVFGIDPNRYLTDYAPKIRSAISDIIDTQGIEQLSKNDVLTRAFGPNWRKIPEVDFFARNLRTETFIDVARNQTNILDMLSFYTEHGYRELYMGKFFKDLRGWFKEVSSRPNMDPAIIDRLKEFYDIAAGHGSEGDWLSRSVALQSYRVSKGFAKGVEKLFGPDSKITKWAAEQVTTDLPGKASALLTHATLNFRPFRGIANLAQGMNVYAMFGDKAVEVMSAMRAADVERLFRKGLLGKNVFATTGESAHTGIKALLEKGLQGQQQSEYITRAWAALAAEKSFNESYERLAKGVINPEQFLRESKIQMLDDTAITEIFGHIKAGNPEAARDMFAEQSIRMLMFDYAKENYPMAFKGVVGRMFGKFGVYPVGQVDLYRRILTSGNKIDRAATAVRLIAASTIITQAFLAAGVDYSGFKWNEVFGFSGGPLYKTGQDILEAMGTGPDADMARANLARSFWFGTDKETGALQVPRLLVPGGLQINSMLKAGAIGADDPYRAFVIAAGAPYRKDWLRNGPRTW